MRRLPHTPKLLSLIITVLAATVLSLFAAPASPAGATDGQCFWVIFPPPIGGVLVCTP